MRYQERQFRGNSYRDFDSGDYYGARRYISDQRMDYDGEGDLPGYDDRFDPRKIAPHQNFNLSDTMRYGKEHARPPSDGEQDKYVH